MPCGDPNAGGDPSFPLHHFQHRPDMSRPFRASEKGGDGWMDEEAFLCSRSECSTTLKVTGSAPRLSPNEIDLLTNQEVISARLQRTISKYPAKFEGDRVLVIPFDVLKTVHSYVLNALKGEKRPVPQLNKRALAMLGEDAEIFFRKFQFRFNQKDEEDLWEPPLLTENQKLYDYLEDVAFELRILMSRFGTKGTEISTSDLTSS